MTSGAAAWRSAGVAKSSSARSSSWALPLGDLVRVDIELLRELGQGLIALQGGERHLGLEGGRDSVGAVSSAALLEGRTIVPSSRAEFSLNRLSYFPEPALRSGWTVAITPLYFTHLGNDITIINGKKPKIICSLCGH